MAHYSEHGIAIGGPAPAGVCFAGSCSTPPDDAFIGPVEMPHFFEEDGRIVVAFNGERVDGGDAPVYRGAKHEINAEAVR